MRATTILVIVAIVAALGAVTLLIRTQEVSAQQSPSQIDQINRQREQTLLPHVGTNNALSEAEQDENAAHTHVSNAVSAQVSRCYNPEAGGFPTPEAPEPCGFR